MILKETIRRVLREESKKYLKPSENVNQLIINDIREAEINLVKKLLRKPFFP